jgi:hypothetical protein
MPIKKEKKRGGAIAMAITLALVFFGHPSNVWIVVLCAVMCACLIYSFSDYPSGEGGGFKWFVRWTFLAVVSVSISAAWGGFWWQRITVSPEKVSFQGYQDETFNFSVRNGRSDDAYDVQVPFLIGYGKHFEDKLSAKVIQNGDPPQRIHIDYNYCFGHKGDGVVSHVQKNEREVMIVRIPHLAPYGSGSFSIT